MSCTINHGFTKPQVQILTDWIHSKKKAFGHLDLPVTSTRKVETHFLLQSLGIDRDACGGEVSGLDVAVARILLRDVTETLPQWEGINGNGEIVLGRDNAWTKDVLRPIGIIPLSLFEINWASSGPGFDWPEAYCACPVPGFDITIVTASADSPDMFGYADYAVGWFNNSDDIVIESGKVIRDWWLFRCDSWVQHPWECLFSNRVVSKDVALSWRDMVWPEEEEEFV